MKQTLPDVDIVSAPVYANESLLHENYSRLRQEAPVCWMEPEGYRPFWALTKHADILEISRQNERFLSAPRLTLTPVAVEEAMQQASGGMMLRTLVNMDKPDHHAYRNLTQAWFMPPNLKKLEARIDELANIFVDRMADLGGECDFAQDVAIWYPLRVIMMILGVPEEDEPLMLKLTQELFGQNDPDMRREKEEDAPRFDPGVLTDFFNYFNALTADRRANPKDDLASLISNATIKDEPIHELEALSYYVIVATAGHDTTSSTTAGGLLALIENSAELEKLQANPDLVASAVDEMIRWTTPVKHFVRTAAEDYELRGQKISEGEFLALFYPSGNRDDEVFDDPYSFQIERSPNKHLAFGYGGHLCLGQHLAKMEIRALYKALIPRLKSIELNGDIARVEANFVSGLKRFPIKYQLK
ncbi:MAG: cytochrome P450 [Pseudomonadota bacterium]